MTDFDPDAYLTERSQASAPEFDPDAYLSDPKAGKGETAPLEAFRVPGVGAYGVANPSPLLNAGVNAALNVPHNAVNAAVDLTTGGSKKTGALEVTPNEPAKQGYSWLGGLFRNANELVGRSTMAGAPNQGPDNKPRSALDLRDTTAGNAIEDVANHALRVAGDVGQIAQVVPAVKGAGTLFDTLKAGRKAEGAVAAADAGEAALTGGNKSAGAAAASVDLGKVSPELRAEVEAAQAKGEINQDALHRHLQAESLPVPVRLTRGQATQDVHYLSDEQNQRGQVAAYADRFRDQNQALVQNLQAIRDQVGQEVFSTDPAGHGETLIASYKAIDEARRADITAKYKALEEANGGDFPIDAKTFIQNADAALKQKMKAPFMPSEVESILKGYREGEPMNFEQFENLRTTLAAEMRKADRAGDGNREAALGLVRDQLEALPMSSDAGNVKALADQARAAAKARFDDLKADPAYKAAVNDTVRPDRFVARFVTGGERNQLALMKQHLAHDPTALQTMSVSALDALREAAGIDRAGNGNFRQFGYNKALEQLQPKLNVLMDPKNAETLQNLGDVARYTSAQPRGSYVNNSNTFVSAAKEHAAGVAEGVANMKAGGVPVGTFARKYFQGKKAAKEAQEALKVGAGISRD